MWPHDPDEDDDFDSEDNGPYEEEENEYEDEMDFADPGGRSALRAATEDDPRIHPCPNCHAPDRLTKRDKSLGYQCDSCADAIERGGP